jgi:hypothetical protein
VASALNNRLLPLPTVVTDRGRASIVLRWVLSRAFVLAILGFFHEGDATGDVTYYARSLHPLFVGGSTSYTLQEYPVPVLGLMVPQWLLAGAHPLGFVILFVCSMLAIDAAFTMVLWRSDGRIRGDATNFWLWFVPMLGPIAYYRFDLVPAVLAGGAILAAVRRPAVAGALTALGACIKLWPVAMLPTLLIRRSGRSAVLTGFIACGIAVVGISLIVGNAARNVSPLYWQSERGLQIESVPAVPLMVARIFQPHRWTLAVSAFKSWEIFGPGVPAAIVASTVCTALGAIVIGWMWWRARTAPDRHAEILGWVFISTTLIVIISNRALSPQYLLWLGGPVAALAVACPGNRDLRQFARLVLVTAFVTQLVFPIDYNELVIEKSGTWFASLLLVTRNGLLLWLTVLSIRNVWRRTRKPVPSTVTAVPVDVLHTS